MPSKLISVLLEPSPRTLTPVMLLAKYSTSMPGRYCSSSPGLRSTMVPNSSAETTLLMLPAMRCSLTAMAEALVSRDESTTKALRLTTSPPSPPGPDARGLSCTSCSAAPPAGTVGDPRRTGVRPLGSYWGAGGENIDVQSGNLNFTVPLLSAIGRGKTSISIALSYNSQNWRQDTGGHWMFVRNTGYGLSWRLMAGSLTPHYDNWTSVHHYSFTDSSGAEYRLAATSETVSGLARRAYTSLTMPTQPLAVQ